MEKRQESIDKLLTDSLNLKDKSESNSLYLEIGEKLSSRDTAENAKAVAAVLKVEELTGKEPEFSGPDATGIKRCLGQDVRDGLINPSAESEKLYSLNKNEPLPGKKDLSEQEIGLRDLEIGLKASGFQSGKQPSSMDAMGIEMLGGQSQENKLNPAPFGEQEADMSFGPSKVLKGMLTQDMDEVRKGLEETIKVGAQKTLADMLGASPPIKLMNFLGSKMPETEMKGDNFATAIMESFIGGKDQKDKDPMSLDAMRESLNGLNEKGNKFIAEVSDAFKTGKVGKEITDLINVSKNGSLEDVEKHVENMFGRLGKKIDGAEEKEEEPKKGDDKKQNQEVDWSAHLAGRIAGATTYKSARSKGINPKGAGEMGAIAEGEATDIASSTKNNDQSKDKALDMAKDTKNMMAKTAASIADKIPTPPMLGKAIAVGIIVADKATDFMIDLINNKGGADSLSKASGSLEQTDKEKQSSPSQEQEKLGGGVEVFRQEMTKTKGGMIRRLIPTQEDVISTAMKGAVDGIGSWGKNEISGKKKPADDIHRQLDQPV